MTLRASAALMVFASIVVLAGSSAHGQYEPFVVEVNPQEISFHIDGPPGIYVADMPVDVSVSSGFAEWTLHCQSTALAEAMRGDEISASRVYLGGIPGDLTQGEETLVSLDQPVQIAQGTFTGPELVPVGSLRFTVRSEWRDKPGTYSGQITFTYLAVP